MSVCATNSVVFDARKVSLSRRKLADNERWAMLNKKTFQEILNALLSQSTSQPSSAASALTFALGQRSASANKSTAPNGRSTTKGREHAFTGDRWAPKDECKATSSNLQPDETSGRIGYCVDSNDDDDYDLEIKDRCAPHEATDNLHSPLPAASSSAAAGSPFIIGLGGTGQREFILGQSNLVGVGENLPGVGIFIVCAIPPSTDRNQFHLAARLLEGATATPNAFARNEGGCVPQARSLDGTSFMRTESEAASGVTGERVAKNPLPRFRLGEKHEKDEEEDGGGDEDVSSAERIEGPDVEGHRIMSRSALTGRNKSRLRNHFRPSHHRSFDSNKVSQITSCSRRLCLSAAEKHGRLNQDQTSEVPAALESFTLDFAQTNTTLSTETSRTRGGSSNTGIISTSYDSNIEIRRSNAFASAISRNVSNELVLRRGRDVGERTKSMNSIANESTHKYSALSDMQISPARVSISGGGGAGSEVSESRHKTYITLPNRTTAPQGAAGMRHSNQSLSLSWSRWMAVDKDVLFCIIEHVLSAEAVAFNSAFCFKTPTATRKGFPSERPVSTDVEKLPEWAALFRSTQLGSIFEETGNRSCRQFPVESRNRQEAVLENRMTDDVKGSLALVENKLDTSTTSPDLGNARRGEGDFASVEISRCFAHFRLGRAEKHRHRVTGRRHVAANRKRRCFQSGIADRATEVTSPYRETTAGAGAGAGCTDDDDGDRHGDGPSGERGVSSFKWKSKMMMRLGVEPHRMVPVTDNEDV